MHQLAGEVYVEDSPVEIAASVQQLPGPPPAVFPDHRSAGAAASGGWCELTCTVFNYHMSCVILPPQYIILVDWATD